ncbi:MAG: nitronate monooxygenase [Armatimonadetes bacterium]|nr:nitronate monooxygenase [Armatimonadota bacterium]
MGVGTSTWRLARAVALAGRALNAAVLGVVSGTGVEALLARRLQDGDPEGHVRRALAAFPFPRISETILNQYYVDVRKPPSARYRLTPRPSDLLSRNPTLRSTVNELSIAANFVEVWLAKEGHDGPIGINHLEKIQLLHLPRLYGAMLAGVDYVLEGAGIPDQVPGVLDRFSNHEPAQYRIDVAGSRERLEITFDPDELHGGSPGQPLRRPRFLAIIASNVLAKVLATRASGHVDGFVIERPTAGGHNAPPRGKFELNDRGEPVYGEKDAVNLAHMSALKRPFWLAGSYASPIMLAEALASGATGIQTGTIFALSEESGLRSDLKQLLRRQAFDRNLDILSSSVASPTGFPFKVAQVDRTLSERATYDARVRRCTAGHLVEVYQTRRGTLGFRCPAEPVEAYVQKGGRRSDTEGSVCICNGLLAAAGYPQLDKLGTEAPVITLGDDVSFIHAMIDDLNGSYSAADAVKYLLSRPVS